MENEYSPLHTTSFPGVDVGVSTAGVANLQPDGQSLQGSTTGFVQGMRQASPRSQSVQPASSYFGDGINAAQFSPLAEGGGTHANKWVPNGNAIAHANTYSSAAGAGHHVDFNSNTNGTKNNLASASFSNSNSHTINDPSTQEYLSPFFQPFGIDVTHFPLTNPPIFQSSLTSLDEPVKRRRISISNGQINQLSEDLETLENLYNTQPPPLPPRFDHQPMQTQIPSQIQNQSQAQTQRHVQRQTQRQDPQPNLAENALRQQAKFQQFESVNNSVPQAHIQANPDDEIAAKSISGSASSTTWENSNGNSLHCSDVLSQQRSSQQVAVDVSPAPVKRSSSSSSNSSYNNRMSDPIPGTNAWKRARLLERNRMAASKCRQRKKVAQLQLQKDFGVISAENKVMKRKLDYYEKLVAKFKRFSEAHLRKCSGSDDSLDIIEEMLMIDSGIKEVDDSGLIVKLEDN
ncbi:hypothetical protein HG535_0F03420 [Zygotorulaspora mrakii]|uniref:BZIP domain-containing protein n=1 Tax=Zygotorulaspora mrakii TaxID=42260 RepID=A0A7H9B561_ZYGMR|nr:uncharacterized protein HG535_0F03420 [Zygotorulaspora mrakii]QLG73831.1 hypothetical protein HG535_0F03420 [Zygotorulaspora mrakii]